MDNIVTNPENTNQLNTNTQNNVLSDQPINEINNLVNNQLDNNQIDNNQIDNNQVDNETQSNEEITNELEDKQRKILNLNVSKWGIVSAVANFASVVFQLYRTMKTQKVKSFSMKFFSLMTFLNFVYVIIGILTENYGMTFACLVFVVYNLIIVYYYYFGKSE
jgi:uncharacterized protein with PQ loop repeat